jgi:hypothetical protein
MEITTNTHNAQTKEDLKNSVLIVSVLVNLFVLTGWLVIESSSNLALALVQG